MFNIKNLLTTQKIETSTKRVFYQHLVLGIFFAGLTIFLFTKLAQNLFFDELNNFDHIVTGFIQGFTSNNITIIMIVITTFGSAFVLVPVAITTIYALLKKKRHSWEALMVIISLSGGWILNDFLKSLFNRQRPDLTWLVKAGGYSFPSGHSMMSAIFYGFLAYLLWGSLMTCKSRIITILVATILILLIGISRIYLGVHYPSDVLAGFAAGSFYLTGCILATQTIRYYKSDK